MPLDNRIDKSRSLVLTRFALHCVRNVKVKKTTYRDNSNYDEMECRLSLAKQQFAHVNFQVTFEINPDKIWEL